MAGTVRRWIIDQQAAQLEWSVEEATYRPEELAQAREVFICNSVLGIVPVRSIDQWQWPVGSLTRALQARYERMLHA